MAAPPRSAAPRNLIAASRFGLGPRPDQPVPADPLPWLDAQLGNAAPPPPPAGHAAAPTVADGFAAFRADRDTPPGPGERRRVAELFRAEALAWAQHLVTTDQPYRERLVGFWANHFTVSRRAGQTTPVIFPYLRDAIRPHVTGRFADMLLAVARHPAMLMYLDNAVSIGPNSLAGQRQSRGLNENLAREILELHTLSPAGGYAQADVTEFARLLTGWSVEREREPLGFIFRPRAHEPGEKTLLGRRFAEGEEGGRQALAFLANHPATHRHLATKLVRHFVADDPPPAAVRRIEAVLRDTQGDLGAAARALPRLPEAWTPLAKFRPPQDFVIAALRAVGAGPAAGQPAIGAMASLAQPPFNAPGPNGWADIAAEWAAPEALMRRVDLVWAMAGRAAAATVDPRAMLETCLGPLASAATRDAVTRAGSVREALTLLLASPEFQRR